MQKQEEYSERSIRFITLPLINSQPYHFIFKSIQYIKQIDYEYVIKKTPFT